MRQYRTSGTVQGAPGNRRSYCETLLHCRMNRALPLIEWVIQALYSLTAKDAKDAKETTIKELRTFI